VATRKFVKYEFVVEYMGELISLRETRERKLKYEADEAIGCYVYYFKFNDKPYW